ncbi:MAG: hypothetical protein U0165_02365 [Polyangiaceae bacterium]
MVTGLVIGCIVAASRSAPAFGPGTQPKAKGYAIREVPALPSLQLASPALDAFGFDRYAATATERPPSESTFIRGRYGIRSTHWVESLNWQPISPIASDVDPLAHELPEAGPPLPSATSPENTDNESEPTPEPLALEPHADRQHRSDLVRWYDSYVVAAASRLRPASRAELIPTELLPTQATPRKPCRKRPVQLSRYGGESDAFLIVGCDGAAAPDALDHLSVLMRPPGLAAPALPLPDEADETAVPLGEWVDGVKLAHPRLLWLVQQIADAFPWRQIYVMSGYRRGGTKACTDKVEPSICTRARRRQ